MSQHNTGLSLQQVIAQRVVVFGPHCHPSRLRALRIPGASGQSTADEYRTQVFINAM
jgi:hypothetical protein